MVIHPSFGKMICYSAILLLSLFFEPNWGQSFEGLASLISNLVSLDNSDLVFISDFQTSQQVSNFQLSNATVFENQQKCLILVIMLPQKIVHIWSKFLTFWNIEKWDFLSNLQTTAIAWKVDQPFLQFTFWQVYFSFLISNVYSSVNLKMSTITLSSSVIHVCLLSAKQR